MRYLKWIGVVAILAVAILIPQITWAEKISDTEPTIRVGLFKGVSSVVIRSDGDFTILDSESGKVLDKSSSGTWTATVSGSKVSFASESARIIRLEPKKDGQLFTVSGKRYRGAIELMNRNGSMTVVNVIDVDQYLYGVLPAEMSPSWAVEALKAQAVAARSYVLHTSGKHKNDGFDVCTTTDCQVYKGFDGESPRTNEAVDATRGEVVTYKGEIILAAFHSASGGYTENSENVWNSPIPYLRGVEDFDQKSSQYAWSLEIKPAELSRKLQSRGYGVGDIERIELSPLEESPQKSSDRGVSGRVTDFVIVGSNKKATISGTTLRSILGLKSTCFDLYVQEDPQGGRQQVRKAKDDWGSRRNSVLVIEGFGWGHGLGLSQWGAKYYAEQHVSEKNVYKKILTHYYEGTEIKKLYK